MFFYDFISLSNRWSRPARTILAQAGGRERQVSRFSGIPGPWAGVKIPFGVSLLPLQPEDRDTDSKNDHIADCRTGHAQALPDR